MKLLIVFLCLTLCATGVFSSTQLIICGNAPGEIYFVGVHPTINRFPGFYYSSDEGETIELRSSTGSQYEQYFGGLLPDVMDSTLYRITWEPYLSEFLSTDGGYSWITVHVSSSTNAYASGVISGEVYRRIVSSPYNRLERSTDYASHYTLCACEGFESSGIYSTALGVDSGEVYVLDFLSNLYYSQDYAEHFTFQSDLHTTWGINTYCYAINGSEPGEIYLFSSDPKIIWRVYDYGDSAQLIVDFPPVYNFWESGVATSGVPGELYFLVERWYGEPGGTIHIYHTTDYFQTYTMYEHVIEWEGVNDPQVSLAPSIDNFQLYPNPTNAAFDITYELNTIQDVRLTIRDILGRQVWQNDIGIQSPGIHRQSFANNNLPSGKYFINLQSDVSNVVTSIIIIK